MTAIPALPDAERRTQYSPAGSAGPFDVGFAIYEDGDDYQTGSFVEVWLNDIKLIPGTDWTLDSPSGTLAMLARPITDARVTLTVPATGTLQIASSARPRRLTQLTEGRGVTADTFNRIATEETAYARDFYDRAQRTPIVPPGSTIGALPGLAARVNGGAGSLAAYDPVTGDPTTVPLGGGGGGGGGGGIVAVATNVVADTIPGFTDNTATAVKASSVAAYSYATLALAAAAVISVVVTHVRTGGYGAVGDGGGALYARVASQPTHAAKFQSADGAWWELSETDPNVLMFGAVADGVETGTFVPSKGGWGTGIAYVVGDTVTTNGFDVYRCLTAHTAGAFFNTDLAAAKWIWVKRGAWVTARAYTVGDIVNTGGTAAYRCLISHTSGTFATDLAAAKWIQIAFTGTDNTAAFQAAADYGGLKKRRIVIAGMFRIADPAPLGNAYSLLVNYGFLDFVGLGPLRSAILIDDDLTGHTVETRLFGTPDTTSVGRTDNELFRLSNLSVRGRWSHGDAADALTSWTGGLGRGVLRVNNFKDVRLADCWFLDIRAIFSGSSYEDTVIVERCRFDRIARGSCTRFNDSNRVISRNNVMRFCDDNMENSVLSRSPTVIEIICEGNTYEQCDGMGVFAVRAATVRNNILRFCRGGLSIGMCFVSTNIGVTPTTLCDVSGNKIYDGISSWSNGTNALVVLTGDPSSFQAGISFGSIPMSSTLTTALPGWSDGTSVIDPLARDSGGNIPVYAITSNAASPDKSQAAGFGFTVTGNIVSRTLPATTNFSDYPGNFKYYTFGGWRDPQVFDTNFFITGIRVQGDIRDALIGGNILTGSRQGFGICLNSTANTDSEGSPNQGRAFVNLVIDGNIVEDCRYGVFNDNYNQGSDNTSDVRVINNTFDIDPFCLQAERSSSPLDGTWVSQSAVNHKPAGICMVGHMGWDISNNKFKNCYTPVTFNGTSLYDKARVRGNVLYCNPAGVGYSVNNIGIADIHTAGDAFDYVIWNGNPQSSTTYGSLKNLCESQASAMPTTGTYVQGHKVWNTDQTSSIAYWHRLTTSTANVLGTDWLAVPRSTRVQKYIDTHTMVANDLFSIVEIQKGTAATFTIDTNANVPAAIGTLMRLVQMGAGQITVAAAAGVTLDSPGGLVKTFAQFSSATLYKTATNEWVLTGDLA